MTKSKIEKNHFLIQFLSKWKLLVYLRILKKFIKSFSLAGERRRRSRKSKNIFFPRSPEAVGSKFRPWLDSIKKFEGNSRQSFTNKQEIKFRTILKFSGSKISQTYKSNQTLYLLLGSWRIELNEKRLKGLTGVSEPQQEPK